MDYKLGEANGKFAMHVLKKNAQVQFRFRGRALCCRKDLTRHRCANHASVCFRARAGVRGLLHTYRIFCQPC